MQKNRNALKAGLAIVVAIALIIGVIIMIRGASYLAEPSVSRSVSFSLTDDVGGLGIGDDVRVGGFKVGQVTAIQVVNADGAAPGGAHISVTYTFPRRYVLRKDAVLRIQTTFTNQSCLNFESLGTTGELPPNVEIVGRPSAFTEFTSAVKKLQPPLQDILANIQQKTLPQVDVTLARFADTADSLKQTGQSSTRLAEDLRAQIDPIVRKYQAVADRASEMMIQVRDLVGDTKTDFRGTLSNLNQTTAAINAKAPALLGRLDDILQKADTMVAGANDALEYIKATAVNAKDMTAGARSVVVDNRGKLDTMIASLKIASDNLKNATAEIRRSPWRLLYKPAPNEMANLNLYDATRQFAEGAGELNDASLALRDAMNDPQSDKTQLVKLMQQVEQSFAKFHEVEQTLWSKVKD